MIALYGPTKRHICEFGHVKHIREGNTVCQFFLVAGLQVVAKLREKRALPTTTMVTRRRSLTRTRTIAMKTDNS